MQGQHRDFFAWTDLTRAMAAAIVVISHARSLLMVDYSGQRQWLPFYAVTGFGHSGVIVFFVLSGFWISRSVLARIDQPHFWTSYCIDRGARLGIVLVPALALGGGLDAVGALWLHWPIYRDLPGAHGLVHDVAGDLTLTTLIGNLAFLQTIAVPPFGSNNPLWSLAFEFWYYLWFPALALALRRRISPALLALLIAVWCPALLWGFVSWLVGLALLWRLDRPAPALGRGWAALAAMLFAGTLIAIELSKKSWTDLPLAISFGLLLLTTARSNLPFPAWLKPIAHYGRNSSFSLYAIHFPILLLTVGWLNGQRRLLPSGRALVLVLALTALCVAAGWLFSRLSESHTRQLRLWLRWHLARPADAQPQ